MTNITDVYPRIFCPECGKITPLLFDRLKNSAELKCETCLRTVAALHEADPTPPVMDRGD
jgi:ribosomal protein S27E